jgi:predicted YcjX-like family ATPase
MIYLHVEKRGSIINIYGRDEYNSLMKKVYYDYSKKEALKSFKKEFDLKYKRNIILLDDN